MPSAYAKPLPRSMVDEAREYQRLYRPHLTTTGTLSFESLSSGKTYTSTTGQSGLFRLLAFALRDYIITLDKPVYDTLATITESGSWTVPAGVEYVTVFLIAGGKTGYDAPWSDVLLAEDLPVTPGSQIPCVVGAAGGDIASRTTSFGDKTVSPTTLTYNDLSHFYNPYDNVFYCPYFLTDEMFPDAMRLPIDDYPVPYPTTPGADGFVGADGADRHPAGQKGGDGYIGGHGGDGVGDNGKDYEDYNSNVTTDNFRGVGAPGGNGGTGHADGQGGNGGNGAKGRTTTSGGYGTTYFTGGRGGNGGDGGNGGNGGNGGGSTNFEDGGRDGGNGGNGGNALRYGGTGGSAGKKGGLANTDGTPGSGKAGAILIFTEHRKKEA